MFAFLFLIVCTAQMLALLVLSHRLVSYLAHRVRGVPTLKHGDQKPVPSVLWDLILRQFHPTRHLLAWVRARLADTLKSQQLTVIPLVFILFRETSCFPVHACTHGFGFMRN